MTHNAFLILLGFLESQSKMSYTPTTENLPVMASIGSPKITKENRALSSLRTETRKHVVSILFALKGAVLFHLTPISVQVA